MDNIKLLTVGSIIVLLHILVNVHISKEIHQWLPSFQKRLVLFFCVWFIPFLGVAITYKTLNLDWFKQKNKNSSSGQSSISGAFLEVDAIFNPGRKYVIEAQQKETIEKREDGEMYKKKPYLNKLKSKNVSDKKA
jgi:hypothetical protein